MARVVVPLMSLGASATLVDESVYIVKLEQPAFGVAPGQSAVFYLGDEVLGGGIIQI